MRYEVHTTGVFDTWARSLRDSQARSVLYNRITRARAGNLGDHKSLGDGLFEMRIFVGKGYRLYFTFHGKRLILLISGGSKGKQRRDISSAYYCQL